MIRKLRLLLCLMLLATVLAACTSASNTEQQVTLQVKEEKLFKGDAALLQPHLDIIGGAAKIQVTGKEQVLSTKCEIWEQGKLITSRDPFSTYLEDHATGHISISLKDSVKQPDMFDLCIAFNSKGGYSSINTFVPRFNSEYGYSRNEFQGELKVKQGEEVAIFSLLASEPEKGIRIGENISENAKTADWALVVKVWVSDQQ